MEETTLINKINGKFYRNAWLISMLAFIVLLFYSVNKRGYPQHTVPAVIIGLMAFVFWFLSALLNRSFAKKGKALSISGKGLKIIFFLISVLVTAYYITTLYLFTTVSVDGNSMKELHNGKTYAVCKVCKNIQRGQSVTYYASNREGDQSQMNYSQYLGRVVGLPGENIKLMKGQLVVNGQVIKEDYADWSNWKTTDKIDIKLGENEYLALFDKRKLDIDQTDFINTFKFNSSNYIGKIL